MAMGVLVLNGLLAGTMAGIGLRNPDQMRAIKPKPE
jgi:hypothetical protein